MGGRNRIGTVRRLALLASAASVLQTAPSFAADLTINTATSTPIDTATGDGTGSGNITVNPGGSITVNGPTAITLNSNNSVSNAGLITNVQETNAVGILGLTTRNGVANNISGTISNLGSITIPGPQTVAQDSFNAGIKVSGLGTFTGNIINSRLIACSDSACSNPTTAITTNGTILVGGNASYGMLVQSNVVGSFTNLGQITAPGDRSYGMALVGHLTGNFLANGVITTPGTGSVGAYIGGGIDGLATVSGVVNAGQGATLTSTNGVTYTTLAPTPSVATVWLASDVTQGLLLTGNQITLANEALDRITAAITSPADSSVIGVGGPGILIAQGGLNTTLANITIGSGTDTGGYSIRSQGNIQIDGTVSGLAASAISVHGTSDGTGTFLSILSGGIWNDKGDIQGVAQDARAVGILIGNYGVVSRIQNDGDIIVSSVDTTSNALTNAAGTKGGPAYGILVDTLGSLPSFNNAGNIDVIADGPNTNAYGVVDLSGTLTSFTNSGLINPSLQLGNTGRLIGVDLSANTSGVTLTNTGTIIGDVNLGAGNTSVAVTGTSASITGNLTFQAGTTKTGTSTFNMNAGTVFGVIDMGNGNGTFTLTNGANASGGLAQGTGSITMSVDASQLKLLSTHPINASTATFTNASTVTFDINNSASALSGGILESAGAVSFSANSKITAAFTGLIDGTQTITLIHAGSLSLGAPLSQVASAPSSYINQASFSLSPTDPNTLLLNVRRKTASELGLGSNMSALYNTFSTALNQDVPLVTAISAIQTADDFNKSLQQLMPDTSGAIQQAALNNQDMASGAIRRRLVGVAKNGMPDHASGDVSSFWAQALGDFGDQKARGEQAGFDIWGLGIAFGADMPTFDNTTDIGFSITETWHSADLRVFHHSPIQFYNSQANLYGRYSGEALYVQANVGGGYNSYSQERHIAIGTISRTASGSWKGYEYGGELEVGYATRVSAYELTPYLRGSYLKNHENAYTETGGGTGVNLTVGAREPENARASAGFTLDRDFPIYYDSYVEAELRGSYTREFLNDPYGVTAQFATGPSFTNFSNARSPDRVSAGFGFAHKDSYSSVSLDYDAELASGYLAHKFAITARFRF